MGKLAIFAMLCAPALAQYTPPGGGGSSPWSSSTGKIFPTVLTNNLGLGTSDPQAPLDIAQTVSDGADNASAQAANIEQIFSGGGADTFMQGFKFESSYAGAGNMLSQIGAEFSLVNDGTAPVSEAVAVFIDGLHGPNYTNFTGLYIAGSATGNATVLCGLCIGDQTLGTTNYAIQTGAGRVDFGESAHAPGFIASGTTFTASGCGNGTLVGGATAGKFTSGDSGGSCSITITMGSSATSAHGWECNIHDITTPSKVWGISASNATTVTMLSPGLTTSGDVVQFACTGF